MSKILVTGGTGYIASHAVVALMERGYEPVLFDNLSNSKLLVLDRIEEITGQRPIFIQGDIRDHQALVSVFNDHAIASVMHFAGLKAVGESVTEAQKYYDNNVAGTLCLSRVMAEAACFQIVFSSSATVYGEPSTVPVTESMPLSATNPYGRTKLMIEQILSDLAAADPRWQVSLLRYFNPIGAHPSGLIGEDPNGIPNNLLPYIAQVASGKLERLAVYGGDYDTIDGTGVRDYIHVMDLVAAHVQALEALTGRHGCQSYNLGTGQGYSVLQVIEAFELASGVSVPYELTSRRAGDAAVSFADPAKSERLLGWKAKLDLAQMMKDHWCWQKNNPSGYQSNQTKV